MSLVAWAPDGYAVSIELLAVKIKPGQVSERLWLEALSDRLGELAEKEGERVTNKACHALGVACTENLLQTGQLLVLNNLNLRTHINLAILDESPWPAIVTENDPEIQEILANQTLLDWVDHAKALVSTSCLD